MRRVLTPQLVVQACCRVGDIEGLGEVLTEVVRGAGLQGATILHHGFDAVGAQRAGELLFFGFQTADDGHSHHLFDEVSVDVVQNHQRFLLGFGFGGVHGVALLPEEFGGAQKRARAHLPAHHVGPLVDQDGQIAV